MFNKLVSNLNFNPGLINQVGFYANRIKQENALRRLSFVFIALAMVVQTIAVVAPPQKSLASSSNHIFDGLTTNNSVRSNVNLIVGAWDSTDVKDIYGYFGVTKQDIANIANTQSKHVRISSCDGQDWWTTGRNSLSGYSKVADQYKNSQVAIEYQPGRNIYQRDLKAWDIVNSCNHYYALQGTIAATGATFYILLDCGNFTTVGRYVPPPPKKPVIGAACEVAGPITIGRDATSATIPVSISLAKNTKIQAGSASGKGKGLHIGVTHKGANRLWNVDDQALISAPPHTAPDTSSNYTPLNTGIKGVGFYQFKWDLDGNTYKRYYVTSAQTSDFTVQLNVAVSDLSDKIVIRLLDRDNGQWLEHSSSCEASIRREAPPEKCEYNPNLNKDDPRCKPCVYTGLTDLWAEDPNCKMPEPDPSLYIRKSVLNKKSNYLPGDQLTYAIEYGNTVNGSAARDVVIADTLNTNFVELISVDPEIADKGLGKIELRHSVLGYSNKVIRVHVRLKDSVKSGDEVCNASSIVASNASKKTSRECFTVIIPCQYDPSIPDERDENCTQPVVACEVTNGVFDQETKKATFTTEVTSSNKGNTSVSRYDYDFGDTATASRESNEFSDTVEHTYKPGRYIMTATVYYRITGQEETEDRRVDCEEEVDFDAPITEEKSVVNLTQKLDEAQTIDPSSRVRSDDELLYTLTTNNTLNYSRDGLEIRDYIGDILDYADLDLTYLKEQGGEYDEEHQEVVWKNVTIPANTSVHHSFKVKMKETIPATNSPSTLGTAYDCEISNEYGNEVSLKVACPAVKGVETLPNTGPGASLIGGMSITFVVGYFYARSRLLRKELSIIRNDFITTGGI